MTKSEVVHEGKKYYKDEGGWFWCSKDSKQVYVSVTYGQTLTREHKIQKAKNG